VLLSIRLSNRFARFIVGGAPAQQLRAHENWRKRVVQIVRHAAGQRADGIHALRAEELGFELFLVCDIAVDEQQLVGLRTRSSRISVQRLATMTTAPGLRLLAQLAVPLAGVSA
jgi:hypothetical protein